MSPAKPTLNRAEQIRQRRKQGTQHRLEKAARHVAAPVTSRGAAGMGRPVLQRAAIPPRRVYTVNAAARPGRGPATFSLPHISLGWRALSALIVLGLAGLLIFALESPIFKVAAPEVSSGSRITADDIETVLKVSGRSIFTLNGNQLLNDLTKALPELSGVTIQIGLPNRVAVSFAESEPVLAWKQHEKVYWVDKNGMIFVPRGPDPAGLVTITSEYSIPLFQLVPTPGPTPTAAATPVGPAAAAPSPTPGPTSGKMDRIVQIAAMQLNSMLPPEAYLIYSKWDGMGWHDSEGWDVYFGKDAENFPMKLSMYQAMVEQFKQKNLKPKYINLKDPYSPYYSMER